VPGARTGLFGFRNAEQSAADFSPISWTMPSTLRGERSGTGRLPDLRGHRLCREASGLEREVRRRSVHPSEMLRLRGNRPQTLDPAHDCGLTARPAVLAKRTEPGRHASRPEGWRSGPTLKFHSWLSAFCFRFHGLPGIALKKFPFVHRGWDGHIEKPHHHFVRSLITPRHSLFWIGIVGIIF